MSPAPTSGTPGSDRSRLVRTAELAERSAEALGTSFTSPLHEPRTAAILGAALGIAFSVCFVTGLLSHLAQHEPSWFAWPARPAGLYRVTQGLHVLTGIASIPLLSAKLWVVFPHLVSWPPARSIAHGIERLALLPLVGGSIFMLFSGTANVARWYPWTFNFPQAHYAVAWITIGGLITHIGAKWATTREALGSFEAALDAPLDGGPTSTAAHQRRAFLTGVAATSGVLFLATAGNTVRPLSWISALAQRRPDDGPQGIPVNKSAEGAGVLPILAAAPYELIVDGRVARPLRLTIDDLRSMPQHEAVLPIACVEGWSADATWTGVPIRDLLARAGARNGARATIISLQPKGGYRTSRLNRGQISDPDTLLALDLNGEELHVDHGRPARLIGPNRPGVLQTKWVGRIEVR